MRVPQNLNYSVVFTPPARVRPAPYFEILDKVTECFIRREMLGAWWGRVGPADVILMFRLRSPVKSG